MNLKSYPTWLNEAIIYQIFPPSFCDSNGDGLGDLNGIRSKLDYIRSLGANTLWLSPIFDSPFRDAGYDVRDYRKIAPRYGSMEDFEALIQAVHARDMRLLLDFVPGHTSSEHPWFLQSCQHERNQYSDRYIWTDRTFYEGSMFDEPDQFIIGHGDRIGNYMSNFFYFQPSLNYGYAEPKPECPFQKDYRDPQLKPLREEMFDIMRFWLDKGVDGYRVDMASSLIKGRDSAAVQRAMVEFWSEVREWWDVDYPDALLLAEWSNPTQAVECGFHLDFMIHFGEANGMKPFRGENDRTILHRNGVSYFDRRGKGSLNSFWEEFERHRDKIAVSGHLSIPTGNHDLPRYALGRDFRDLKIINTFLFTLPQVPTIYYGDEIGMRNLSDLPSKEGAYDRTGARTPMQWDGSVNAGFSSSAPEALYLPVDPKPERPTVASQDADENSLLHHVKTLIALREAHPALGLEGTLRLINHGGGDYPLLYLRELETEGFLIVLNPLESKRIVEFELSGEAGTFLYGQIDLQTQEDSTQRAVIEPLSACILEWKPRH